MFDRLVESCLLLAALAGSLPAQAPGPSVRDSILYRFADTASNSHALRYEDPRTGQTYALKDSVVLDGHGIALVEVRPRPVGSDTTVDIIARLEPSAAATFSAATASHIGQFLVVTIGNRVIAAAVVASPLRSVVPLMTGVSRTAAESLAVRINSERTSAREAGSLKVILLGTGVGPVVNLQQYGASILIEAGGQRFLFDCGRGATMRLAQAGAPLGSITRVFLTHLHSDHVVQLPDLLLTGWAAGRRAAPLSVWGPVGTRAMMEHLQQAFDFDIHMRRDVDERFPASGISVVSHDITADGVVFAEHGVMITAFLVDHGLVKPAFGYRIDFGGRSVVLSGDTRVSENLIRHALHADVLIHEAIDPEALRTRADRPSATTIDAIIAHHTTPEQAGTVFRRVAPRLAVYSHAPNTERVLAQTRTTYDGPLQGPEDLLTILIGAEIRVEHHAAPQSPRTP